MGNSVSPKKNYEGLHFTFIIFHEPLEFGLNSFGPKLSHYATTETE